MNPSQRLRRSPFALVLVTLVTLSTSAFAATPRTDAATPTGPFDGPAIARALAGKAGAPSKALVSGFERVALGGGVAHYRFDLAIGPGEHDRIRLHRVVREIVPFVPKRSADAIMLAHGDGFPFVTTFLTSTLIPDFPDTANMAAFLAAGGVDVWGIDFRWVLVDADTTDLSFLDAVGLGTDAEDLDTALAVARLLRLVTGSGGGRLHLAGYSRGGQTAYAYLSAESQRPFFLRHVRGFIPIDIMAKTDEEDLRLRACANVADAQGRIDQGMFASPGATIAMLGQLALDAPDDPSPFLPFLSNGTLMRLIGADFDDDLSPTFHRTGGIIDDLTLDTELLFSPDRLWYAWNAGIVSFEPFRVILEGETLRCDEEDSPFDDHFADITVPVLYVGAAGGFGEAGIFNTTLLGSTDVSSLIVRALAAGEEAQDFGHIDLFTGTDADSLVWQPILDWIRDH